MGSLRSSFEKASYDSGQSEVFLAFFSDGKMSGKRDRQQRALPLSRVTNIPIPKRQGMFETG